MILYFQDLALLGHMFLHTNSKLSWESTTIYHLHMEIHLLSI